MTIFEILAECSIAVAGFGAVHAALQGSSGPRGIFRAWTVVWHGAVAFVLSIVPLLLALTTLSEDQLWRVASAIGVALAGFLVYVALRIDVRMTRMGYPPQATILIRIAEGLSVLAVLLLFSNVFGWLLTPGPFLYATGPIMILIGGLIAMLHSFLLPIQLFFDSESADTHNP